MRPLLKWTLRIVGAVAVVVAMLLFVQVYLLPGWVGSQLVARLRAMGLNQAEVTVERVGWRGAELTGLRLSQEEWLSVDHARITYQPNQIASGRIQSLILSGARLRLVYRDGKLLFEPLSQIQLGGESATDRLPFDRIELHSSLLIVDLGGEQWAAPVHGSVTRTDEMKLTLDVAARLRDHPVHLRAELALGPEEVEVAGARIEWTPRPFAVASHVVLPAADGRIVLSSDSRDGPLIIRWGEGGQRIAGGSFELRAGPMEFWDGSDPGRIDESRWHISPAAGTEPGIWFMNEPGAHAVMSIAVRSAAPLRMASGELLASARQIGIMVNAGFSGVPPPRVQGVLEIEGGEMSHASGLALSGIEMKIPVAINTPTTPQPQQFSIAALTYGDQKLAPISGTAVADHQGLDLIAHWPIAPRATVGLEANYSQSGLRAAAKLPPTELQDLRPLLAQFADLAGVEISGRVSGDLVLDSASGKFEPRLALSLQDVGYQSKESQTTAQGVRGELLFDSVLPLRTPGGQRLRIARLQQGKLTLTAGTVDFRVESPDRLFIEQTDWTLGQGGRITAHAIRYDQDRPFVETELFIDDLNLEDWLSVLTNEKVTATGKLYGRVPLRIRQQGGRYQIAFGEGFLYSTAGTGRLRVADAADVSRMLAQADPRFTQEPQLAAVRERLASALTDFEYSMFRFDLIPREDRSVTLRVQTRGRGRGPDGQEVGNLTINFNNFGAVANMALFGQWLLGEGIEQRLEEFFRPVERNRGTTP